MLKAEVMRPSALGAAERAAWAGMMAAEPALHRAFLAHRFALACEAAHGRAYVGVLHEGGSIRGFFPFQFAGAWHERLRLAERIGGSFADTAGLVAAPGFTTDPATLLRLCGIGRLFMAELGEGQDRFGLTTTEGRVSYLIELADGPAAYFGGLDARHHDWVQNSRRKLRRAERELGALRLEQDGRPAAAALESLIAAKRDQYRRTGVGDPFADPGRMRLLAALLDDPQPDCRAEIATLYAADRPIAQHLGLLCHGTLSWWFPVYDTELAKLSPGRLLLWQIIAAAATTGLTLIDCGEGEQDYKRLFATRPARYGRANWSAGLLRGAAGRLWQAAEWRLARRRAATAAPAVP